MRPFLKWAGGKTQLLTQLEPLYPRGEVRGYVEPFLGGGAVFFHVQAVLAPARVALSDGNAELVSAFEAVREDVDGVIERLSRHKQSHSEEYFYAVREQDPAALPSKTERAARLIYLNKTCFNGLYRVNSRGRFNVPFGHRKNPGICDPDALREASASLRNAKLRTGHFREVVRVAKEGDFVYFDPPYDPVSRTANFTSYTEAAFGERDQRELAEVFRSLDESGCKVMLSNSDTPFVRALYKGFHIEQVYARRSINSRGDGRGRIPEVVVTNYRPRAARSASAKPAKLANRAADAPE